ncbi:MAG: DUF3945 domain-containing protein [Rikenellaceae bacterium]
MEQNIKDKDVLLVKEPNVDEVRVVSNIGDDGRLKTLPADRLNESEFLKIDRHGNMLENFFSNLMRQAKDPSHFNFFRVQLEDVEQSAQSISNVYKGGTDIDDEVIARESQVQPEDYAKEQTKEQSNGYKSLDAEKIDWSQFEAIGLKREQIEKSGALTEMLNYRKSPELMNLSMKVCDVAINTQGRLSLREMADGRIIPVIHAIRNAPELDRPLYGYKFTAEDKTNLTTTGNMGRLADIVNRKTGEVTQSYISIDRLTNELITMRADRVKIPNEIKGVTLTPEQKASIKSGEATFIEGMTSKAGKKFDAYVQINAEKRGIEFRFGDTQRQTQSQSQTQSNDQPKEVRIPKRLGGQDVTPEDQQKLREGGTIYIEGLKDKEGKTYNAYIKVNNEMGKLDFYRYNPNKAQSKGAEVTPDNASQTQVAVNSEGKTNEATKNLKEPLQQGQTAPREEQQQKPKGLKM